MCGFLYPRAKHSSERVKFLSMYAIKPKETEYNGIKFRSRLEARYACFFDLLGWKYVYEPDMQFKNWIPDFLINTQHNFDILVEVKPSYLHTVDLKLRMQCETDCTHHILLVNESPQLNDDHLFILGDLWKVSSIDNDGIFDCYEYDKGAIKNDLDGYGLSHYDLNWNDIVKNVYYKNFSENKLITSLWNEAGNKIQFKTY